MSLILLKLFQNIQKEGRLPSSFYIVSITLIPKQGTDITKKENYMPIFHKNIKNTIYQDQVGFIQGIQIGTILAHQ